MGDFVINVFRSILFFFDQIIYGFIPTLYNFIDLLARQTLFSDADIQKFANNIYAVLGVFMLFRLAFVLLTAIIDPDKLTDKNKGAAKLISRAIIALVLIVAIPWAFTFAFRLQKVILDKNLIAKIIIGSGGEENTAPGQQMGKIALSSFLACSDAVKSCDQDALDAGYAAAFPAKDADNPNSSFQKLSDILNNKTESKNPDEGEVYMYNYSAVISTICGGFILFMLITFSFDIAVRVVKLGFLQLMTPVAVIGYIEPGGGIFNRWLKMCVSTYINLFIRILAITFVIYILSLLDNATLFVDAEGNAVTGVTLAFVKIFIIIGALMFAKEAPNMLKSLFNLNEGSLGSLNPLKKLASVPVIGGAAAAGVGLGASAATGMLGKGAAGAAGGIAGAISSKYRGGSAWAGAKQGASSAASGISLKGGTKGMGKQFSGVMASWNKGATAGAVGAAGKDTKVGMDAYMEHRKNLTADQQAQAVAASQKKKAEALYNKLQAKKAAAGRGANPYGSTPNDPEKLYSDNYGSAVWNLDQSKDALKIKELQRQAAYNKYALNPGDAATQADYDKANAEYITAQKATDYYKGELDRMDKMEMYSTDAAKRSLIDAYGAQVKAAGTINPTPGPTPGPNPGGGNPGGGNPGGGNPTP